MEKFSLGCLTALTTMLSGMVLGLALVALFSYFAMLLWNDVMPQMFGVPQITFWKMLELDVLLYIIFPKTYIARK